MNRIRAIPLVALKAQAKGDRLIPEGNLSRIVEDVAGTIVHKKHLIHKTSFCELSSCQVTITIT